MKLQAKDSKVLDTGRKVIETGEHYEIERSKLDLWYTVLWTDPNTNLYVYMTDEEIFKLFDVYPRHIKSIEDLTKIDSGTNVIVQSAMDYMENELPYGIYRYEGVGEINGTMFVLLQSENSHIVTHIR